MTKKSHDEERPTVLARPGCLLFFLSAEHHVKIIIGRLRRTGSAENVHCTSLSADTHQSDRFSLTDALPFITFGTEAIVQDEFSKCFEPKLPILAAYASNVMGLPIYFFGVIIRYLFLFPTRYACTLVRCLI